MLQVCQEVETEWFLHGEHPPQPDGDAVAVQLRHAARVSHLTPLAAHAQLLSEHLPAEELPSAKQIEQARRQRGRRLQDSGAAYGSGEEWIHQIRQAVGVDAGPPSKLLWFHLTADVPRP